MVRVPVMLMIGLVLSLMLSGLGQVHAGSSNCSQAIEQGVHAGSVDCGPSQEARSHGSCALPGPCMAGICLGFLASSCSPYFPVLLQVKFPVSHARPVEGRAFPPPFKPPRLSV
jgi:hypothetical protein